MELFNVITNPQAMLAAAASDKKDAVSIEGDSIRISYAGFNVGVKYVEKAPFHTVTLQDDGAPFHFIFKIHLDGMDGATRTCFWMELDAELNFMMRSLLGGKIKDAMDQVVDSLAAGRNLMGGGTL